MKHKTIPIEIPNALIKRIDDLLSIGLYGKTRSEVIERLVCAQILLMLHNHPDSHEEAIEPRFPNIDQWK